MTKEVYVDIIKYIVMYVMLCNLTLVYPIMNYLNNMIQHQSNIYSNEFNKIHLSLEENTGVVLTEHTIIRFEEIQATEFTVSEKIPLSDELQEFLWYICKMYNLEYHLVLAIIDIESGFNSNAVSYGNYGLMQINEVNHKWLQDELLIGEDFLNPYNNLIAGCYMLHQINQKYDNDKTLMVYNIGESGANKLFNQNIYSTSYTNKVLDKSDYYWEVVNLEW